MTQDKAINSLTLFFKDIQKYQGHANNGTQFEEIVRQLLTKFKFMQKQ